MRSLDLTGKRFGRGEMPRSAASMIERAKKKGLKVFVWLVGGQ